MAGHARDSGRSVRRRLEGSFNAAAAEEHGTNSCQSMAAASSKKSLAESLDLNPDATPSPKKPASKRQKRRHSTPEAPSKERASVPVVMSSPGCVCVCLYIYIYIYIYIFFSICVCACVDTREYKRL